jgi:hypothetical protein
VKSAYAWLVSLVGLAYLAVAASQIDASGMLVGIAVLTVVVLVSARYLAVSIVALTLTIGSRSRQHREVLHGMVAPRHPNIPGRPRTRAPGQSEAVA